MDVIFKDNVKTKSNLLVVDDMEYGDLFIPIGTDELYYMTENGAYNFETGQEMDYDKYPYCYPVEKVVGHVMVEDLISE